MPDMEGILRRVARKPYRSIIDRQDAYEQIRVIPEHVDRTAVTTPDGNMVSHVVQQGNCSVPATYQALVKHIFGEFIGVFTIIGILEKEKLYLSKNNLRFLCNEVKRYVSACTPHCRVALGLPKFSSVQFGDHFC